MSGMPLVGALTDPQIARAAGAPDLTVDDFLAAAQHGLAQMAAASVEHLPRWEQLAEADAKAQLEDGIAAIRDGEISPEELNDMIDELGSRGLLDKYREA